MLDIGFIIDVLVNDKVIIELKSVEEFSKVHHKQIQNYLKLTNLRLGILVNFNTDEISKSISRKVNKYNPIDDDYNNLKGAYNYED